MRIRLYSIAALAGALIFGGATASAQTLSARHVMLDKLLRTQRIVEALMKGEDDALAHEADALSRLTQQPGWMVLTTAEYVHYSSAFLNVTTALAAAAREGDLDGAARQYAGMVMACYSCHQYVKSARITQISLDGDGGQKPPARHPPVKPPSTPDAPKAVPKAPPPAQAHPRPPAGAQIYGYPLLLQPEFVYRFPYGLYPYYQWGYPYPWYGYPSPGYSIAVPESTTGSSTEDGTVQFDVTPTETRVFVDDFYVGSIDEFEGKQLSLPPGPHHIELQADGYQPVILNVRVQSNHTIKYRATLKREESGT